MKDAILVGLVDPLAAGAAIGEADGAAEGVGRGLGLRWGRRSRRLRAELCGKRAREGREKKRRLRVRETVV